MRTPLRRRTRSGFTLVEIAIATSILVMLSGILITTLDNLRSITVAGGVDAKLQEAGEHAMTQILADLRRSGVGVSTPYLFDDGNATGLFVNHAHAAAVHHAVAGEPDFGPNREIVFLLPADADLNGTPDIDVNGRLMWGATEFSFVLVTSPNGINTLQRRVNTGSPRNLASNVERIAIEPVGVAVPLEVIRVRIFLRQTDDVGVVHRYLAEARVQLRNG